MTDWKMNDTSLERGMLIRRPGLDEALEVVNVSEGQAKIKLPGGKTSTIPASAEVEWSWPEGKGPKDSKPPNKPEPLTYKEQFEQMHGDNATLGAEASDPENVYISDEGEVSGWQTDWNLLDVGSKISVLGEPGDFTILRLTDSTARIKHNTTAQIQPLSIGHKFKLLDTSAKDSKLAKSTKGKARKPRSDKGTKVGIDPDMEPEQLDIDPIDITTLGPSDDDLAAIENGDDNGSDPVDDDELDLSDDPFDTDLEDLDSDDTNDDLDLDNDDDEKENDPMPNRKSKPAKPNTRIPARIAANSDTDRGSLLTLGQIAERTGISYPTLVRYVRDHSDRLPSEGEGRSRRYYPDAIDVFREIRGETKGGRKPGAGNKASAGTRKPKAANVSKASAPSSAGRAPSLATVHVGTRSQSAVTSQPIASSTSSFTLTIDSKLGEAIDHANAQISVLEALVENLEAQRESLKLWS